MGVYRVSCEPGASAEAEAAGWAKNRHWDEGASALARCFIQMQVHFHFHFHVHEHFHFGRPHTPPLSLLALWSLHPPCLPPKAATSPRPPPPSALSSTVRRRRLAPARLGSANALRQKIQRARSLHPRLPDAEPHPPPHPPLLLPPRLPLLRPPRLPSPPLPPSCPRRLPPRTPLPTLRTLSRSSPPSNQMPPLHPSLRLSPRL